MNNNFNKFISVLKNPLKYKLFLLTKLPLGFFTGLKIININQNECSVAIRYKWLNKNPFKSLYFAALSMAAELSTGALAFGNLYQSYPAISMLVTQMQANFHKKAVGKIIFTCSNGIEISNAIQQAKINKVSTLVHCKTIGINEQGIVVAEFIFSWSFMVKS